jgi:hypothetical protein
MSKDEDRLPGNREPPLGPARILLRSVPAGAALLRTPDAKILTCLDRDFASRRCHFSTTFWKASLVLGTLTKPLVKVSVHTLGAFDVESEGTGTFFGMTPFPECALLGRQMSHSPARER